LSSVYSYVALSKDPLARVMRSIYRSIRDFSLPAPRWIVRPILGLFITLREVYYFLYRVLICEPFFKAYCTEFGRNVHTGAFIHWVRGDGRLILGDDVTIDGKCSFIFAVRYTSQPTLRIGNHVRIGDSCTFTVGREISIGNNVMMGAKSELFDSPGHPTDPALRLSGSPALPQDVKAICIEDNVWVGSGTTIFPGVTIGEGSIVARGAVVMSNVPPYVIVAGSPARQIARLNDPRESG
jgi:acetyltransferase-like isoleucine patch superfamily enzyme